MFYKKLLPMFCLMAALMIAAPSDANDKKIEPAQTPVSEWIAAENKLIDTLDAQDQETFFILRNKHSVIRTLYVVRGDIKGAVELCAKDNENLADEITARFSQWEDAVLPILKEAQDFLDTEINEEKTVFATDARHVFKLNDAAYEFSQSKIEKQPISDEKSCKALMKSMDKTENELIELLQNILLPKEVVKERLEQERKAAKNNKSEQ